MCGRYALYEIQSKIREHFGTKNELDLTPRFNIVPTQTVPVMDKPRPERFMEAYPVSRKVNSPQHDSPDLIEPAQEGS